MPMQRPRTGYVFLALIASLAAVRLLAAPVSVTDLTAAFLYNFARFTAWPLDVVPAGAPIALCVVGSPDVARALARAAQGKVIDGRPLLVRKMDANGALRTCQLLYAGDVDARRAGQLLDAVKDAPVLTVSDQAAFTAMGGTAYLYMEGERMRFAVNVESALRSNIRISAQLLNLARIVKDDHAPTR